MLKIKSIPVPTLINPGVNVSIYNIIIMHVYIAPEPGNAVLRRCTVFYSYRPG